MKTDNELKELVAKMLPKRLWMSDEPALYWIPEGEEKIAEDWLNGILIDVRDTEMLAICQMIAKETMNYREQGEYITRLKRIYSRSMGSFPTWQECVQELAQLKEIK